MQRTYQDELGWAYHGEVYGEAMFDGMAETARDPRHGEQLRLMALLERQTKEQLAPLCDREGVTRDDPVHRADGTAFAERSRRPDWDHERFLRSFESITSHALPRYRAMRDHLAPAADVTVMDALIAHEEALQGYADRLLAGEADATGTFLEALVAPYRHAAEAQLGESRSVSPPTGTA